MRVPGADPGICEGRAVPPLPFQFLSPVAFPFPSPLEVGPLKPAREYVGAL